MYVRPAFHEPDPGPFPLLDSKFDIGEDDLLLSGDHYAVEPVSLADDLSWEDQLDNGEEVSL